MIQSEETDTARPAANWLYYPSSIAPPSSASSSIWAAFHHDVGPNPCSAIDACRKKLIIYHETGAQTHENGERSARLHLFGNLHTLGHLDRTRLVVVELVAFDANADDLALVDPHPLRYRSVEELVRLRLRVSGGHPEMRAFVWVAGGIDVSKD